MIDITVNTLGYFVMILGGLLIGRGSNWGPFVCMLAVYLVMSDIGSEIPISSILGPR